MVLAGYKAALLAGMTDGQFWRSTPYLTRIFIEQAGERERLSLKREMFNAWYAGAFFRIKRMPSLENVMRGLDGNKLVKRMTPDEMLKVIEDWNRALGGDDKRKPPKHAN